MSSIAGDLRSALRADLRQVAVVVPAALGYAVILHWVYAVKVAPTFAYLGYSYRTPDAHFYTLALLLFVTVAVALPPRIRRPSDFVLWLLFILAAGPSILVPQYAGVISPGMGTAASLGFGAGFLTTTILTRRLRLHVMPHGRSSGTTLWVLIGTVSVAFYVFLAITVGLHVRLVGLLSVYDLRSEYRADIASVGRVLSYVLVWQGNVLNPVMVVWGLFQRKVLPVVLGGLGQLIIFSAAGHKTIMLSMVALIAVGWWLTWRPHLPGTAILWGASLLSVAWVVVDQFAGSVTWTSIFVRRLLLTSGMLTSTYVTFFNDHPKLYLSQSFTASWLDYPYALPYTRVVGEYVTGSSEVSMNAHILADGFANAGWPGVAAASVLLALVLALVDDASRDLPIAVPATILLLPTIALANGGLLTVLLSHGLGLAVVVLAILPRTGWSRCPTCQPRQRTGVSGAEAHAASCRAAARAQ
ncbi:hypothetical protein [Actinoplanes aureus]|uniref:Uncharacterized protein n=1 Tax=Actinoplanes aureus TaxID=2792083 RepID=A0A931CAC2_9ACTN|nr:hypothetical protein [Actinoplanes aureus]MBG0562458.1 hypothetical protein [Actinoplanes aureus]